MDMPSALQERASASTAVRRWLPGMRGSPPVARYLLAVLMFGAALGSRFAVSGFLPTQGFPFLTFFPAVMLSAWLAGLGPGLLCSALSIVGAWYYFIPPVETFLPLTRPDTVALLFFSAVLLIDCVIIHVMNQALGSRAQAMDDLEQSRAQALAVAEAAERERSLLDATFNTVPAGIIVADAQGRLVRMSRATEKIWGLAPYSHNVEGYGEWKGWWADGSDRHGQRIEPHEWGLARSLHGEYCHDIVEVEPFGRPGERVVTILAAAPVLGANGRIIGGVVVQVDITDRIQAENALREADRQKDTFLATLSHELRNPLAPIRAAAHVIRLSDQCDERVRKAAAVIERQGAQLTQLVDELLDLSRQKSGRLTPQREEEPPPDEPAITTVNEATVLVVDDNEDAASTLQLLLQMQGLVVETASDGASAVAAAHRCRPRVIVLDIGLPDMTGYEVARHIREASSPPAWPHRPVLIALTGWGQAKDRQRALEAGFDHHLTKPADPDRIAALVQEQLQPA